MNQYIWSNIFFIIWLFVGLFCWDGNALLHRIGIIGGGPSGLMSAIRCAELLKQHKIQNEVRFIHLFNYIFNDIYLFIRLLSLKTIKSL